jgi:hypothetical protein
VRPLSRAAGAITPENTTTIPLVDSRVAIIRSVLTRGATHCGSATGLAVILLALMSTMEICSPSVLSANLFAFDSEALR